MVFQSYLPEIGGAQRQLHLQAPLLQKMGFDVQVVTRRRPGLSKYELMGTIPVHRIPAPGPKPIAALVYVFLSLKKIWQLKPDMLHAFELLSPTTTAIMAKKLLNIPLAVKVLRGGRLGDIYKITRGFWGKWRMSWIRNNVDAYAVISVEIDSELESNGVHPSRRVFIPNGVDLTRFFILPASQKAGLRTQLHLPDGMLVIFTGRFEPEKKLGELLAVWQSIRQQYGNAWLILAGSGSEETRLRALAGDGVIFTGSVKDVVPFLQASDVFVLPSATEGLSNALLEAMACGLPVVVTDVGGASDVVSSGEDGILIPPDNPVELKEALITLLENQDMRDRLGDAARKRIEEQYSLDEVVRKLSTLYENMLGSIEG